MRPKERIKPILKKIDIVKFLSSFKNGDKQIFGTDIIKSCAQNYKKNKKEIEKTWLSNPDIRFIQLLINNGLIPNIPGFYYYIEETDWLIENKIFEPQELLFWGTYGKDGKQPLKWIAIKDMENSHLKACLKTQSMNPNYKKAMEAELKKRKNKT